MSLPGNGKKNTGKSRGFREYIRRNQFQRLIIALVTLFAAFFIIVNGAVPKKYKLNLMDKSPYDIIAPREIENRIKTEENANAAAQAVPPVMIKLDSVPIEMLNLTDDFFTAIYSVRKSMEKSIQSQGITKKDRDYKDKIELEQALAVKRLAEEVKSFKLPLSEEQLKYLVARVSEEELDAFKNITRELVSGIMQEEITEENLTGKVAKLQDVYQKSSLNQELKNIGSYFVKAVMRPNRSIDEELTRAKREEILKNAMDNKVKISEGARIISVGDLVTEDKLQMLEDLNLIETGRFDFVFAAGIFAVFVLLSTLLIIYLKFFCKKIYNSRDDMILLSVVVLLTLVIARVIYTYSSLLIPVFMASMLISILLDLKLAVVVNAILTMALMFMTKWDMSFFYMAMISGTFAAFIAAKANQRSKLSAAGLIVAGINIIIVASMGVLAKRGVKGIAGDCLLASVNGIVSAVLTIGILPFFESTFNIITPLKLLELANPNQPLIKRLLMEAPGTYHHSLMVGNLAEVATEAINGNELLARVGAYYHDIGKLKRPNFFIENQMSDNPHDRMTANLSTLVITSHTHDGVELAHKYKLPLAIREIIAQHHGNTLVAYFYHKARKNDKGETVKQEDFRYDGPKPASKEAAVVMLADSVEAAVRSMMEKTEGKIEGMVRKIIKDKLDDGQLDLCELTLKDLDDIAQSFVRVFGGYFHEREEYPDLKQKPVENINMEHAELAACVPVQKENDGGSVKEVMKTTI